MPRNKKPIENEQNDSTKRTKNGSKKNVCNDIGKERNKRHSTRNYRKIWETYHNCCLMPGVEIHHIDGNHNNNDISNLLPVTLEEHYSIHCVQNDYGACQALLMRMANRSSEISECAAKVQEERWKLGIHNFQKMSPEERMEMNRAVGIKTRDMKLGIHRINSDPVLAKENSRRAGKVAWAKRAGFLDPTKSGSNYVKNTKWWIDPITKNRKRATECPGPQWKQGMNL